MAFVVCLLVFKIKQYVKLQASWELPGMQKTDSRVLQGLYSCAMYTGCMYRKEVCISRAGKQVKQKTCAVVMTSC